MLHDILGLGTRRPKHAKLYADLNETISGALRSYVEEVGSGQFPTEQHTVPIDDAVLRELLSSVEPGG